LLTRNVTYRRDRGEPRKRAILLADPQDRMLHPEVLVADEAIMGGFLPRSATSV
jgi:hypothetical protein